jgi:hypothetical protein
VRDIPRLAQILARTQTLMDPQAYVKQTKNLRPRAFPAVSESSNDQASSATLRGA